MKALTAEALLPSSLDARKILHLSQHGHTLRSFRKTVQQAFEDEIARLCRDFIDGPLKTQKDPVVSALCGYLSWLGWCAWCSCHLAPPLGLAGAADARRLAAALLVYCGPRLLDDAIDDHATYKGLQDTTLARLMHAFPSERTGTLRSQVALLGAWMMAHGVRRLRRHAGMRAADTTLQLFAQNAPAAVLEGLHPNPLTWAQYQQVVLSKSARYDRILYSNLIDPVPEPLKGRILEVAERLSVLGQYLNDFGDRREDQGSGQTNLLQWFASEGQFWEFCRAEAAETVALLDGLPDEIGNALAVAMIDTVDGAARMALWKRQALRDEIATAG